MRYIPKFALPAWLAKVDAHLPISRLIHSRPLVLIWRVAREMIDDDATQLAASVAYFAIFSLFPMLLGFLSVMGLVLVSEETKNSLLALVNQSLPGSEEFISTVVPVVEYNIDSLVSFRVPLGLIALAGVIWSATGVWASISRAVDRAWDIPYRRPYLTNKLRQILMLLIMGLLVATTAVASASR